MAASRFAWFQSRSPRERLMLGALAAVLVGALFWLLVLRPLWAARADAEARLGTAVTELAQLRADAAARSRQSGAGAPLSGPLDAFLTRAATEAGFANAIVTPQGPGRAALTIPAARPAALLGWLGQVEQGGAVVETINVTANQDQSVAVQAVLKARGN